MFPSWKWCFQFNSDVSKLCFHLVRIYLSLKSTVTIFLKIFLTLTCSICMWAAIKCFSVHKKLQSEHPYKTGVSSLFLFESFSFVSISTGGKSGIVNIGADDECLLYLCSVDFRLILRVFFTRLSDRQDSPVSFNKIATSRSASWSAKSNPPIPKDGSRPTCWPLSFFKR